MWMFGFLECRFWPKESLDGWSVEDFMSIYYYTWQWCGWIVLWESSPSSSVMFLKQRIKWAMLLILEACNAFNGPNWQALLAGNFTFAPPFCSWADEGQVRSKVPCLLPTLARRLKRKPNPGQWGTAGRKAGEVLPWVDEWAVWQLKRWGNSLANKRWLTGGGAFNRWGGDWLYMCCLVIKCLIWFRQHYMWTLPTVVVNQRLELRCLSPTRIMVKNALWHPNVKKVLPFAAGILYSPTEASGLYKGMWEQSPGLWLCTLNRG